MPPLFAGQPFAFHVSRLWKRLDQAWSGHPTLGRSAARRIASSERRSDCEGRLDQISGLQDLHEILGRSGGVKFVCCWAPR